MQHKWVDLYGWRRIGDLFCMWDEQAIAGWLPSASPVRFLPILSVRASILFVFFAARFAVTGNFHLIAAHAKRKEMTVTIDGMRPKEASTDMLACQRGTFSTPRTLLRSCYTISYAQLVLFLRNAQSFSMTSRARVTQRLQKQHGRLWQWRLARG